MGFWEAVARIIGAIFSLVFVLFLAYLLLNWLNKRMPGMSGGAGRLIQILDRVPAGRGGTIMLLRVQEKVLLVAVTEKTATKLCEFDDPEGQIKNAELPENVHFSAVLKDALGKFAPTAKENNPQSESPAIPEEKKEQQDGREEGEK